MSSDVHTQAAKTGVGLDPVISNVAHARRLVWSAIGFICLASAAHAACEGHEETFLSCTFKGAKTVDVCIDGDFVSYAFGPPGAPELALQTHILDVDYRPWPGVGSTIWEEVAFENGNVSYVVTGSLTRTYPENENEEIITTSGGGIDVIEAGITLATLECDAGSADYGWSSTIYDAKTAAGLCWDADYFEWRDCQ